MSFLKKAFFSASSILPLNVLCKNSGISLLLPYHHVVSDDSLPHIQNLYAYKNRKQFINDLDWLLKHFHPVHPHEVAASVLEQKPLPEKSFLLSFDDGYREVYDVVAPILAAKGVPSLFFINPAFIDNRELFYRCKLSLIIEKIRNNETLIEVIARNLNCQANNFFQLKEKILSITYGEKSLADELASSLQIDFDEFLLKQKPFLTTEQITSLTQQGFVIGAHSWDHPHYKFLSLNEQVIQTEKSLEFVRNIQPGPFQYFSFPHEDKQVPSMFFLELSSQKNLLFFGTQNQKDERYNKILHRYNAENPQQDFASRTKAILTYNSLLKLKGKSQVERS